MEMSELKTLRCPQNWGFNEFKDIEEHLLKKDKGLLDEENSMENTKYGCLFGRFKTFCLLSYEAYRKNKCDEALDYLEKADVTDDFIDKYSRVFQHVIKASRAHILYAMNLVDDAKKIAVKLNKETFSKPEDAAFMYVQCAFQIKYGVCGADGCVELIESALKIVSDEPEFHYIHGVTLSQIRHFTFPSPPPSSKEFDALRRAVTLRKDIPEYSIALARLYMDSRHKLPFHQRKQYVDTAESIYRNLLKYHESMSGNSIARCVFNLIKIKFNPDLEEYANLALTKSNSTLVNHYVGSFYLRNKQYEEAYACFDCASIDLPFITGLVLLMMYRINGDSISDVDIESRIKEWTCSYESLKEEKLHIFYLAISQFYLIVMDDLKSASLFLLKAAKYNITEPNFISLTQKYSSCNYLSVLKNQLFSYKDDDETILEGKHLFKNLPKKVFSEVNYKLQTPNLFEIRKCLH